MIIKIKITNLLHILIVDFEQTITVIFKVVFTIKSAFNCDYKIYTVHMKIAQTLFINISFI